MALGIVTFFHVERGFGRIKTEDHPNGVFVHFSDVDSPAKILVENELVEFSIQQTAKGPKAEGVFRLTERMTGTLQNFDKGFGQIREKNSGNLYFVHHSDIIGNGFKHIDAEFEVEFSHFENGKGFQAKEVVVSDRRQALERFAWLGDFDRHLHRLAGMAQAERWEYSNDHDHRFPILKSYLNHTFRRLKEEDKIAFSCAHEEKRYACFNTGLVTEKQEEIFAYLVPNKHRKRSDSYLQRPKWMLKCFGRESHRMMSHFPDRPKIASYFDDASELIYDSNRRLVPDYNHIVEDRFERFPAHLRSLGHNELLSRVRHAIILAERRVKRNYRTAIPQFYEGNIQLLLPLSLEHPYRVDMALVVAKEHQIYRANTVIPLEWAYQNARLIAPPYLNWFEAPSH
ncbi:MAG: DUF3825 domain-containing protein [Bacteroidota bacterium]